MTFTEEDIPLMKLIFNPSTHDMGMLVGRERAKEMFEYVCNLINRDRLNFKNYIGDFYYGILKNETICNFFWDNSILKTDLLEGAIIYRVFRYSPIAEKILNTQNIDFNKLDRFHSHWILTDSPIAEKVWDSGKLDLNKLVSHNIKEILIDSPISNKIFFSGKLDLTKLESIDIYHILLLSPIAEEIWKSNKLNLSLLSDNRLEYFKQKFEPECNSQKTMYL